MAGGGDRVASYSGFVSRAIVDFRNIALHPAIDGIFPSASYTRTRCRVDINLLSPTTGMLCPFQYVPGYFTEDAGGDNHDKMVPPRFGLDDSLKWADLWKAINDLNTSGNDNTLYKVFFLGRHGQGVHNLPYSPDKDVNDARGPDPHLTQDGIMEVITVNAVWRTERQNNLGLPTTKWCSPLTRCMETNTITFGRLLDAAPDDTQVPPTTLPKALIVEKVRERCTHDNPQERLSKTFIQTVFPEYDIEDGFTEEDEMWTSIKERAELDVDVQARAIEILRRIFTDPNSGNFISITTHSGFIKDLLTVIAHPAYVTHPAAVVSFVCSYTLADDHYLPFVCKIADSSVDTLLLTVASQDNDASLMVKTCTDTGLLLQRYRWVLVPMKETSKGVQYNLVNEWTIKDSYTVTTWSKNDDLKNGQPTGSAQTGTANTLFYVTASDDDYVICPVDKTKVFGVTDSDGSIVDLVKSDDTNYTRTWKITGL